MILKKIGVMSAGKISGIMYTILGLIAGAFMSLFSLMATVFSGGDGGLGIFFGIGAIIFLPIFYGVIGFVAGLLCAFIYNWIAKAIGGLEMEFEDDKPISEHPISQ